MVTSSSNVGGFVGVECYGLDRSFVRPPVLMSDSTAEGRPRNISLTGCSLRALLWLLKVPLPPVSDFDASIAGTILL